MDMGSGNLQSWGFDESEPYAGKPSSSMDLGDQPPAMELNPLSPVANPASASAPLPTATSDKPQVSEEVYLQAMMETRSTTDCKSSSISYNEKELREAAALEVAEQRAREKEMSDGQGESSRKSGQPTGTIPRRKLTAEEKAAASRYRNREHARNTRLRKKAYMQKLKDLVDDLEQQRKDEVRAKEVAATRLRDQQNYRRTVVQEFLHLRSTADKDRSKWARVVEEGLVFTLPITPYRYFSRSDVVHSLRMLVGIDAAISDAASLRLMSEAMSLANGAAQKVGNKDPILLQYRFNPENTVISRDSIMCRWALTSAPNAQNAQFHVEGMLYGKFSSQNRLSSVEMMFDVMTVMKQLQQSISGMNCDVFIVPNTLEAALQPSSSARVIVKAEPSFPVLHVNEQWTILRGFTQEDSEGRPLDLLQYGEGPQAAIQEVLLGRPSSSTVVCYKATGEAFMASLQLFPLYSHGEGVTHILGVLRGVNPMA